MKLLHFSDLHIGVETHGQPDPQTGLSTRLQDFLRVYNEIVEAAIAEQVDLVLFCGDAYKARDPSQTHQREFAKGIARLTSAGIPVFLLVGNHDLPNALGRATALEIFDTLSIALVTVAPRLGTYRVETRAGPLQIVALPWIRRGAWLAQDDTRRLTAEQLNQQIEASLTAAIAAEAAGLDPALPAVFAGHVTVSEARLSSERTMMIGRDHVLLRSSLALPAFDYVALGHIHKHQVLYQHPPIVYSGSPERVDFSEEDQEKGFVLVEIDPARPRGERVRFEFRPTPARRFVTIEVEATGPDPTARVLRAIERKGVAEAIVRLYIQTTAEAAQELRGTDIQRALEPAFHVATVRREIAQEARQRIPGLGSESLPPLDALRTYLASQPQVPPERAQAALAKARALLAEQGEGAPLESAAPPEEKPRLLP